MNATETRQYEMLVRVRDFGTSYGHLFPESSVGRQKFAEVAAAVKELDAHALTHMTAVVSASASQKAAARAALRGELQAMSQTARVLAEDAQGLDRQFELPDPATDPAMLTAGRKFARDAEPFSKEFIAHGMKSTFLADLDALVDNFEHALLARGMGRDERLAAKASIKAAVSSGLAAVRRLNVIVTNALKNDDVTRTVWNRDRRIVYPERGTAATPESTPTVAAAASAQAGASAPSASV